MDHTHPNGSEETIDAITMIQVENTETDVDLLNNKAIDVVAMGSPMSASDENVKTTTMSDMTSSCSPSSIQSASSSGAIAIEGARSQPLDMPWSDVQASALHDKVSRFTVQVPKSSDNRSDNKDSAADTMRCVVLWRNLIYDTPALAGYPIETLIQQLRILSEKKEFPLHVNYEEVLPFLDAFEFEASGGMSANVYGVSGIADGTRIRTSPVNDVHVTLPFNFVCTADGSVLYELGRPLALESTQLQQEQQQKLQQQLGDYSLSGTTKSWQRNGKDVAAAMLATTVSDANRVLLERQQNLNRESIDPDLLQLGGLTALVIGGALAMESLSHHLTVNVFWV